MFTIYNEILYRPLLNTLVLFYDTIAFGDLGLSIIFLTILIRLVLFPLFHKGARHQMIMQKIQPHIKKVQDDHKNDKHKQVEAMLSVYREHKINPFAGPFIILVQLPILIALYQIFLNTLKPGFLDALYAFIPKPDALNPTFLGLMDLSESSILVVGLAALAQYFQAKLAIHKRKEGAELTQTEKMARNMVFVGPLITIAIFYNFPAAVALYWTATSVFSVFQQMIVNKSLKDGSADQKNN